MKKLFLFFLVISFQLSAQTTFHGNNNRTGAYETPGPKGFKGIKWSFKTDGPIASSPAVFNGTVYIGSNDTHLYALDQQTGKEKWKYKTRGPVSSSPALDGGLVYFGSFDGRFYALDATTGTLKWSFAIEVAERRFEAKGIHGNSSKEQMIPDAWDFYMSSPVIHKSRVYFGSSNGNVYALNSETGNLVWKFSTQAVVHASPAISGNVLFIGAMDSNFYALDADSGVEKWRFKAGEDMVNHNQVGFQSSSAIVNGIVYVGCRDAHVYALDELTGKKKWDYYTNRTWVSATPAVSNGVVYAIANEAFALDARTGKLIYVFEKAEWSPSSIIVADGVAYAAQFTGRMLAHDTKTGKIAWEFKTESAKADPFKVLSAEGSWNNGAFKATFFDFQDDYIDMFRRYSVGAILSTPVVEKGMLIFGGTDGMVYCLE
jgi:outer membrane protein assembly factor BamB